MKEKLYNDISANIKEIREKVSSAALKANRDPNDIKIMAVTKTVDPELINISIDHGICLLGENRAQEMLSKIDHYNLSNTEIHFIGALQTNKVKQIIDHVTMIHSVDRLALVKEINKQATLRKKKIDILIQVNVGKENSKSGIFPEHVLEFVDQIKNFPNINLRGLMAIPPICEKIIDLEKYFAILQQIFIDIQAKNKDNKTIDILSMGMSGDFETAIQYGANIIRIGTALFGARH